MYQKPKAKRQLQTYCVWLEQPGKIIYGTKNLVVNDYGLWLWNVDSGSIMVYGYEILIFSITWKSLNGIIYKIKFVKNYNYIKRI